MTQSEALAWFAFIALGELLAFMVFLSPLLLPPRQTWKSHCFRIGRRTATTVVVLALLFFIAASLFYELSVPTLAPYVVAGVYFINTVGLTLAVARTGGPIASFYSPLLSAQLAGFLLVLEAYEGASMWSAGVYVFLSVSGLIYSQVRCNGGINEPRIKYFALFTGSLGMLFAFLGFALPRCETCLAFLESYLSKIAA